MYNESGRGITAKVGKILMNYLNYNYLLRNNIILGISTEIVKD
jgi:hypothetical protein